MDQYLTVYIIVVFILTFIIPLYMIARLGYFISPVLSHYIFFHKWCNYEKFDKNIQAILFSLLVLSLFFGVIYFKPLLNELNFYYLILLTISQSSILIIFEFKCPRNCIVFFKNLYNDPKSFFKINQVQLFEIESKEMIDQKENINELKSFIEKTTHLMLYSNEVSFQEFRNITTQEKTKNTELKVFIENKVEEISVSNKLNFQKLCNTIEELNRNNIDIQPRKENYSDNELSEICKTYQISLASINEVQLLISGKKIGKKIIFTGVHNKLYNKKLVVNFFKDHFYIYDDNQKLKSHLNQKLVLNFINSNIEFVSDKELKKKQILFITKSDLSKK